LDRVQGAAERAYLNFRQATHIGDLFYFVRTWPAFFIRPESREVAPVLRVYIGDMSGKLVFERNMVITGAIDLANDLLSSVASDVEGLQKLEMSAILPVSKEETMKMLTDIEKSVTRLRQSLDLMEVHSEDPKSAETQSNDKD